MKKPKEEIVKTTIRVRKAVWDEVRIAAIKEDTSAEALVEKALEAYLRKGSRP